MPAFLWANYGPHTEGHPVESIEFSKIGYDFSAEDAIIVALDRDALIIDAAFFVLIFGQIENRINELAAIKMETETRRRALREQKFEKRMELALPGVGNKSVRGEIAGWYSLRNDAAHGERLSEYNIDTVFERAEWLEAILGDSRTAVV